MSSTQCAAAREIAPALCAKNPTAVMIESAKWPARVAATLNASFGKKQGLEDQHIAAIAPWFVPAASGALRRLTVTECERLQGFPDGHTLVPRAKDGPRLKAIGNSMAVPVMRWIGERIEDYLEVYS